jgi:thymidylate synthase
MNYVCSPYDEALRTILNYGERRKNRTGIDTLQIFSMTQHYMINNRFPLLTKRKLPFKSMIAELLWILSGDTYEPNLRDAGCRFWEPWSDIRNEENRKFYERTRFKEGYLGPVYGWQLRHFGADYKWFMKTEDIIGGFDQLTWLINEIWTNPSSRRLIVNYWNPKDINIMRIPVCHYSFHIDVDEQRRMTLLLNQRSCDFPVGVPFNIGFYSTLCYLLAQQTDCIPHKFIHHTEDAHIYVNQIDAVKKYLDTEPSESPKLNIKKRNHIDKYTLDDFELISYCPKEKINIPVIV